jgi:magnesium transporter
MLVNCVVYQEGKKLADIKQSEIHDYLAKPGCFVWVALRDASDPEIEEMRQQFDLHELSVEDARHGAGYVLYALMDAVVDRYFPVLDTIETELEAIEGRIFANTLPRANIEALYYVKQKVTTLKHATAPLMESVGKLYGGRVPMVCQGLGEYFRDVYDHLVRLNQSLDSLRDTINTALQVNLAMITIGESEVTKRLAAYAALVAVPTMIAGVYGMNFKNMPELNWVWGYPFALFLMLGIDVFLFRKFRKAGWL